MADPALDIANLLDQDVGALAFGVNLFTGLVRPVSETVPAEAVFIHASGGPAADRFIGMPGELRAPSVQVRVRSPSYKDGLSLIRAIYEAAQSSRPSGYMDVHAQQSEPIYMEQDKNKNHQWSLNFTMDYQA